MEEEFYCSIKLVSGEEIFSLVCATHEENGTFLILDNPVLIECIESRKGNLIGYKVKPWMNIPDDEMFVISIDKIITMTEITSSKTIDMYKRYLSKSNFAVIDRQMGLISKVDEARVFLENIYNLK
jgi:hypothetical protein